MVSEDGGAGLDRQVGVSDLGKFIGAGDVVVDVQYRTERAGGDRLVQGDGGILGYARLDSGDTQDGAWLSVQIRVDGDPAAVDAFSRSTATTTTVCRCWSGRRHRPIRSPWLLRGRRSFVIDEDIAEDMAELVEPDVTELAAAGVLVLVLAIAKGPRPGLAAVTCGYQMELPELFDDSDRLNTKTSLQPH